MTAAVVVFCYLALVLYVGIFAFRSSQRNKPEDFFVANRSLGTFVFLLSLFGSNMTSFSILGASGLAFRTGIMVFGLMASISAIIIPLTLFLIGTRIWAIGKKFGHMTQVQIFRDRWEMGHIGTIIFLLEAVMLVPYIIIGVMGGGETLQGISGGQVPYWLGGLIVAMVVMSYVFFGGMRGTAWVNALQTLMFLTVGTIAFIVIAGGIGGIAPAVAKMAASEDKRLLMRTTAGMPWGLWLSYALIPLSSIMFPHIAIFCLTARKMSSFRKTVIFYPLCIMALWLPGIVLGSVAPSQPEVVALLASKAKGFEQFAQRHPEVAMLIGDMRDQRVQRGDPKLAILGDQPAYGELRRLANAGSDGVMLAMLNWYAPAALAGLLGAAIMACVMASDSQILALSTMWAEDVYRFHGGTSDAGRVWSARIFVIFCTVAAYIIALSVHQFANIFELAIQYAFSGYASLAPIMIACLFWKRSTKWGALAATLFVAITLLLTSYLQYRTIHLAPATPAAPPVPIWSLFGHPVLLREFSRISFMEYRFLIVVPMFIGSCLAVVIGSLVTRPPSRATLERYFPAGAGIQSAPFYGA